jgi:hypothetical protein
MDFDTYTYTIGAHFLPALIDGDESGLSLEDCNALAGFDANLPGAGHWSVDDADSFDFARCDVTGMHSAVVVCQYLVPVRA